MVKRLRSAKGSDGEPLLSHDRSRGHSVKGGDSARCKEALAMAGGAACGTSSTSSREEAIRVGKELMQSRLGCLRMDMVKMEDDGNCQFRAISQELFGSQGSHYEVRRVAASHMKKSQNDFKVFFESEDEWVEYMNAMVSLGTWGDELTLRAVADAFRVKIHVVTSEPDNWYLTYLPKGQTSVRDLFLTYISPIHYNTLAPAFS